MNRYLLIYIVLIHRVSSVTVRNGAVLKASDKSLDLIKNHFYPPNFYPNLINNASHDFPSDSVQDCLQEFLRFWEDLNNEQQAAYFDSFGKVGAGILTGNIVYLGYYDECIDIGNTEFCRFPIEVMLTSTKSYNTSVTIPFEFGMCFPSSCDAKDFYSLFFIELQEIFHNKSFVDINVNVTNYTITVMMPPIGHQEPQCPWRNLKWTTSSIIMLTICLLFTLLVITGTTVDVVLWFISKLYFPETEPLLITSTGTIVIDSTSCEVKNSINEDDPLINDKLKLRSIAKTKFIEFLNDFILSFSLYKTVPILMATHQPANAITSINGIRVISLCWLISANIFVWGLKFGITANIKEFIDTVPKHFLMQWVFNGTYSVDSFFVLSGLLMCYLSIKEMERHEGKFPFVFYYVHHLLRLSPAYYFVLFFNFKILPYIGSGPLWFFQDVSNCEKYWWTNILYINNFYPTTYLNQCYSVAWYLANDVQFFIIFPIFSLLLYHFWKIGVAIIAIIMLVSIAITGILAGINDLNANYIQEDMNGHGDPNFTMFNIFEKPYCRINAYLVGIILGFVFFKKWKVSFNSYCIHISFYSVLWIIAVVSCLTIVFGLYPTWNGHQFSKSENVMYFMFSRTIYSTGIALMIYACHNGFGGLINTFLSWRFWIPLSRLTLMAYLSHPMVLTLMYGTFRSQVFYTDWLAILLFPAVILVSYCLALILAITVQYPLFNVQTAVYKLVGVKRTNKKL